MVDSFLMYFSNASKQASIARYGPIISFDAHAGQRFSACAVSGRCAGSLIAHLVVGRRCSACPAYFIQARFNVKVPGVAQEVAEAIAHEAHEIHPYSKATRGNIDVGLTVVVS